MHNTYFFLNKYFEKLLPELINTELLMSFSQVKGELILGFANQHKEVYLKTSLTSSYAGFSLVHTFARAKRNTIDLFKSLIGAKVVSGKMHSFERSFELIFDTRQSLIFKMHGGRSNVLLFQQFSCVEMFHQNMKFDLEYNPTNDFQAPNFEKFKSVEGDLKNLYPTFDKHILSYFNTKNYQLLEINEQWDLLQRTLHILSNPEKIFITQINNELVLTFLEIGEIKQFFTNIIEASNLYYQTITYQDQLKKEKKQLISELEYKLKKAETYVKTVFDKLNEFQEKVQPDEIANIIMANMHLIKQGMTEVVLYNFYTNEDIKISLKPTLNAQQNAALHYRKAKNKSIEINKMIENMEEKERQVSQLKSLLEKIYPIENLKELRGFVTEKSLKKDAAQTVDSLFRKFEFQGFTILMGRNAKNSDLLLKEYTHKEDLWLHAKDVKGSHVIIKQQSGKKFPKPVIERAAMLAAWHSDGKTNGVCPVSVTPRKFIHKPKGAADGQVIIKQEDVLLVQPMNWE